MTSANGNPSPNADRRDLTLPTVACVVMLVLVGNGTVRGSSLVTLTAGTAAAACGQTPLFEFDDTPAEESRDAPTSAVEPNFEAGAPAASGAALDDLLGDDEDLGEINTERLCDVIYQIRAGNRRSLNVELLKRPLGDVKRDATYAFIGIGSTGKGKTKLEISGYELNGVVYYEERMVERAASELKMTVAELLEGETYLDLTHPERAKAAKRARWLLNEGISQHDSARQLFIRQGEAWDQLRTPLERALLRVNLSLIQRQLERGEASRALAACQQLHPRHRHHGQLALFFEQLLLAPAAAAYRANDFASARTQLEDYLRYYPQGSAGLELHQQMVARANALVDQAREQKDHRLLEKAAEIWPRLSAIDETRRMLIREYPVLHCAFPHLPARFSPLSARTTVERQITPLLFDRLVQWRPDAGHYDARLADDMPRPLARGREFHLPQAVWSDSDAQPNYVTADDVRVTVELLRQRPTYQFPRSWSLRIGDIQPDFQDDPFRVAIRLTVDHWQPLSFMDFPVVPRSSFPVLNDEEELQRAIQRFEQEPVGTGPYRLHPEGRAADQVRFVANPHFRDLGHPVIREVVIHQMESAAAIADFGKGNLHLIYDVRPELVDQMGGRNIERLRDRSVYFLAPNYKNPALRNENLRLAIAHAIPRQEIIAGIFRPGRRFSSDHAALTGPYPTKSWAYDASVPEFMTRKAKQHLDAARDELGGLPESLKLVYPDDNPDVGRACEEIRKTLAAAPLGLQLELEAVSAVDYQGRVVDQRQFDLAYWRHEFDDETYWIWPLLDPAESRPGGANFMGYVPDAAMHQLFDRIQRQKQFRTIRKATHETHKYIARTAAVIPLWELDVYVAVSDSLQGAPRGFDAGNVFENVENWTLRSDR